MTENEQKAYELSDVLVVMVISLVDVVSEEEYEKIDSNCVKIVNCLWELARYKDLGTIEEFKALKENERKCKDCAGCTNWMCDCANERANAIDDFVERITLPLTEEDIARIVEELKGGAV